MAAVFPLSGGVTPPPAAAASVPLSAADLSECASLYDLSSGDLSARLAALVASVGAAAGGSAAAVPMDLDRFLLVERQILLIHQELRERHLAEQLARDPWMDSELDDAAAGIESMRPQMQNQNDNQSQTPFHAAAHATAAASSSAARAANANGGGAEQRPQGQQQQQWANQHADRRGLEEARRRAGGAHGPVRSSGAAGHKLKPGGAGGGSGGGSHGPAIPESILNQRREMVIMTSSVNNRRAQPKAPGGAGSAKKKNTGGPSPAGSPPLPSQAPSPSHAASAASSHRSASGRSDAAPAQRIKRSASVGPGGRGGAGALGAGSAKKKTKAAPELSVTQKAKQYAAAQQEARRAASAGTKGVSAAGPAPSPANNNELSLAPTGSEAFSLVDGAREALAAPVSARSASPRAVFTEHSGTDADAADPAAATDHVLTNPALSEAVAEVDEEELALDGSYSPSEDDGDGADEADHAAASTTSARARAAPSAHASMDHAAIALAQSQSQWQGDASASASATPAGAAEIEEHLEGVHAEEAREGHEGARDDDGDFGVGAASSSRSPRRSRSRSPSPATSASASAAAVAVRPVQVQVQPVPAAAAGAAEENESYYSDESYSDAHLSDSADEQERATDRGAELDSFEGAQATRHLDPSRKAPHLRLNAADVPTTAATAAPPAGSGISAAAWAKAAAAGDSVLRDLQRKAKGGRIAPRNVTAVSALSSPTGSGPASSPTAASGGGRNRARMASDPRREAEKALARHAKLREAERAAAAAAASNAKGETEEKAAAAIPGKTKRRTAKDYLEGIMGTGAGVGAGAGSAAKPAAGKAKSSEAEAEVATDPASTAVVVAPAAPRPRRPARPPLHTHAYELYFPGGSMEFVFSAMWSASTSGLGLGLPGASVAPPVGQNWFSALVAQIAQVEKFKNAMAKLGGGGGGGAQMRGGSASAGASGNGSSQAMLRLQRANEIRAEYLPGTLQGALVPGAVVLAAPGGARLSSADVRALEQSRALKAQRTLAQQQQLAQALQARPSSSASSSGGAGAGGEGDACTDDGGEGLDDEAAARDMGPGGCSTAMVFLVTREREEVHTAVRMALLSLEDDAPEEEEEARAQEGGGAGAGASPPAAAPESAPPSAEGPGSDGDQPATTATTAASTIVPAPAPRRRRPPRVWVECPPEDLPPPDRLFPFLPPNFTTSAIGSAPSPPALPAPVPLYANPPSAQAAEKEREREKAAAAAAAAAGVAAPGSSAEFSQGGQFHELSASSLRGSSSLLPSSSSAGPALYWNLLWTWRKPHLDWAKLLAWQRVNHFPDSRALTRKDLLKKSLERYSMHRGFKHAREWGAVMPRSFILPQEFQQFLEAFTRAAAENDSARLQAQAAQAQGGQAPPPPPPNYWICKPPSLSRGRGIFLASRLDQVDLGAPLLVQRYIPDPLLLAGHKFDLRLYVLLTSTQPLEAFVYREGFARISTAKYNTDEAGLGNRFVHLTNSSVQKNNILARDGSEIGGAGVADHARQAAAQASAAPVAGPNRTGDPRFDRPAGGGASTSSSASSSGAQAGHTKQSLTSHIFADPLGDGGSKISLAYLWTLLRAEGIDTEALWQRITRLLVLTLAAVEDAIAPCVNSFELFGFDVLIDAGLRPHLIEVNASPSMGLDTPLDKVIKPRLLRHTVDLVDPLCVHRTFLARVLERRAASGHFETAAPRSREQKVRATREMLHRILQGERPRLVGEQPARMGLYERLAPNTPVHDAVQRMKRAAFQPSTNAEHKYRRSLPPLA